MTTVNWHRICPVHYPKIRMFFCEPLVSRRDNISHLRRIHVWKWSRGTGHFWGWRSSPSRSPRCASCLVNKQISSLSRQVTAPRWHNGPWIRVQTDKQLRIQAAAAWAQLQDSFWSPSLFSVFTKCPLCCPKSPSQEPLSWTDADGRF